MVEDANLMLSYELDVFENKFIHWNRLPRHLKIQVLGNVPYPTLRNFTFLSKECYELGSLVETEAYAVSLRKLSEDGEGQHGETSAELEVLYASPEDNDNPDVYKPFTVLFTNDKNGGCYVQRVRERKKQYYFGKQLHYANETCLSAAIRVFFNITRNVKAKQLEFDIGSSSPDVENALKQQEQVAVFKSKTFIIRTDDPTLPPSLFPFISPGSGLKVYSNPFPEPGDFILYSASFNLELLRAAPSFDTEGNVGLTDEQLPNLRGHSLSMKAPCITSKSINTIIKQWLEGSRNIVEMFFDESGRMNNTEVFDGIDDSAILSEAEILRIPIISERLDPTGYPGFHAGIRRKSGSLLVITLELNRCVLFDAYAEKEED